MNVHLFSLLCSLTLVNFKSAPNVPPQETVNDIPQVVPLKQIIDWRYKVINGNLYKRKYNYSTSKWIGEWLKV